MDNTQYYSEFPLESASGNAAVARLAYELWLQRGSPQGSPDEDWFHAETLLQTPTQINAAPGAL